MARIAERALGETLTLAKALPAEVILLQVVPVADDIIRQGPLTLSVDEPWNANRECAIRYLETVRSRLEWQNVTTDIAVEPGNPAETILNFCQQRGIRGQCKT
jgi:nucleotide-binding universal stress UspA family protein